MKPFRPLLLSAAAALAAGAVARDSLRVDAQPLFRGVGADYSTMAVTIDNDGLEARGVLRVIGEGSDTSYPVVIPAGGTTRVSAVDATHSYGMVQIVLETDRGTARTLVPGGVASYGEGGAALLVGDGEGGLSFLRQKDAEGRRTVSAADLYVRAEDAPGRAVAYAPFNAVVLAPGAERLADAAVAALKDYALGGGTLVFLGGEDAPVLADRRWSEVLPGADWHGRRVGSGTALAVLAGGTDVPKAFTVVTPGAVSVGASPVGDGRTFEWQRGLGLGRTVVLGWSPLDAAFEDWGGRLAAFRPLVRGASSLRAHQYVEHYLNAGLNGDRTYRYEASEREQESTVHDPFSAKLPPAGTVFGLLGAYFLLVVPASFLVLRRMKRGELAWVTAPLLSLGFAGALFKSAEGLYAAKLSSAAQGVVVLQEGEPRGMFYGTGQMFFPRGGDYDLGLRDVDSLNPARRNDAYGVGTLAGFDPVDTGREVTVPSLEANNLAFREMSFSQRIPKADWFRIDVVDGKHVRVENRSPYAFQGGLNARGVTSVVFRLSPGASKTVDLVDTKERDAVIREDERPKEQEVRNVIDPGNFTDKTDRLALAGRITGFRPGPKVGEEVQSQSGIDVIAFAQERLP